MNIQMTELQLAFHEAKQDEVLFGGSAGGGKSFGQLIDALLYASEYPGIKQLILRRTYPELEKSLIRNSLGLYPRAIATYNDSKKMWTFKNGSLIDFGYCDNEKDVYKYQSSEYDVIRFDEATHFNEFMYVYIKSRCRGANSFPKQLKCSTNPGGVGHSFFKERFIDKGTKEYKDEFGTRLFIPAKLKDNKFLMEQDPDYVKRLESLPDKEKKALLEGDWNIFDGMYFSEFRTDVHVIEPFEIPTNWNRYITIDYGLDMLACLWIAVDTHDNAYVYKELYESNLIISDACKRIQEVNNGDNYQCIYAPPDLWQRKSNTGEDSYQVFDRYGIRLTKSNNDRVQGWYAVKEYLKILNSKDEVTGEPIKTSKLKVFRNCLNLIRTLPQLQMDEKNPNDVSNQPHELTHINDALRGWCIERLPKPIQPLNEMEEWKLHQYEEVVEAIAGSGYEDLINY